MLSKLQALVTRTSNRGRAVPSIAATVSSANAHTLRDNYRLTPEQYAYCVGLIDRVEKLYEIAPDYIRQRGLDPALFLPGNEWADIVPIRGKVFLKGYNDVNYLRLMSPFAGFYLVFLDRLDVRLYAEPWNDEFLKEINLGMRDDVAEFLTSRVDPVQRLTAALDIQGKISSCIDEQRRYTRNVPRPYIVRTPRLFGEIGIEVDGLIVNPDTLLCQSRMNGMLCAGVLSKLQTDVARRGRVRVLEIGPGNGPLGQALADIFGDRLEYIAVDLPSSLYNSSLYLSTLANGERCHVLFPGEKVPDAFRFLFVANFLLEEVGDALGPIDLAINAMSFPEMSPAQVRYYALLLKRLLRPDGVVFDENDANKPHHTDSKAIFADVFPYRKRSASNIVATKNWCQDVWAKNYVGEVFNCSDFLQQGDLIRPRSCGADV